MNQIAANLLSSLTLGKIEAEARDNEAPDLVRVLAKAYEVARNALEYRADHLVRRAAIERILKRQLVFERKPEMMSEALLQELKWARYVADPKSESALVKQIGNIIAMYQPSLTSSPVSRDWLVGMISAEIEEKLNPNSDYHKFTTFAFHVLKNRVKLPEVENIDLLLYVAIDRVYSMSDNQQVSYHLMKLIRSQTAENESVSLNQLLEKVFKYCELVDNSPTMNRISVFIRKQIGPLVLLRDMYFAEPERFGVILTDKALFEETVEDVLNQQMRKMRSRLNRAAVRSLVYVFLTKMLLVLAVEIPVERLLRGNNGMFTVLANLILPVLIMWILTSRIKLPGEREQTALKQAVSDLIFIENEDIPEDHILSSLNQNSSQVLFILYYIFYGILFIGIFLGLVLLLTWAGFTFVSLGIFLFFLSLVVFFAFRIKQTAMLYSYRPKTKGGSSFSDNLMLPIVTVGGLLSQGVSRMNFLVFLFDFILESPFKIILHFLDKWFSFLTVKKDEIVG